MSFTIFNEEPIKVKDYKRNPKLIEIKKKMAYLIDEYECADAMKRDELTEIIQDLNIQEVKYDYALLMLEKPIKR
jgi:hypothetical protein